MTNKIKNIKKCKWMQRLLMLHRKQFLLVNKHIRVDKMENKVRALCLTYGTWQCKLITTIRKTNNYNTRNKSFEITFWSIVWTLSNGKTDFFFFDLSMVSRASVKAHLSIGVGNVLPTRSSMSCNWIINKRKNCVCVFF